MNAPEHTPTNDAPNQAAFQPNRPAAFSETMQIGIVVRDLDATLRRYVDDFGIAPGNSSR